MFEGKLNKLRRDFDALQRIARETPGDAQDSLAGALADLGRSLQEFRDLLAAPTEQAVEDARASAAIKGARSYSSRRGRHERLRALAEQGPVLIRIMGDGASCRWANPAWLAFTGRSMEEVVGEGWLQDVHPEDHARCAGIGRGADERRGFECIEYRLRRAGGAYGWILEIGVPRLSTSGSSGSYLGTGIDITQQKQAETTLALQSAVVSILAGAGPSQEAVVQVLQLICERLGWDVAELWWNDPETNAPRCTHRWASPSAELPGSPGRPPTSAPPPVLDSPRQRHEPEWAADIAAEGNAARDPEARRMEERGMALLPVPVDEEADASLRVYCLKTRQRQDDVEEAMRSVAAQIGRHLAHQRLLQRIRTSEDRKAAILDASHDGVITIDHQGRVLEFNQTAELLFGYRREQALGRLLQDLVVPPQMRREFQRAVQGYIVSGASKSPSGRIDALAMKADGTQFPVEIVLPRKRNGDPPLFTIYVRDATERNREIEELGVYRRRLRALMSDLLLVEENERKLLAIDLHDGLSQTMALAQIKLAALRATVHGKGEASIDEVVGLLEQANVSARLISFELSPPVLHDLGIEPAVQWLVENIERRYGITIELDLDSQPKPADTQTRILLYRSIRELLINVAKHAGARRIHVRLERERDELNAVVEDDGVGMPTIDPKSFGTGLFSIGERLNHIGGSMHIESSPGKGTTVRLRAPLKTPVPQASGAKA